MIGYWDQEAVDKTPNTYKLTPKNIKKIKVLDWDRLKKMTWYNQALSKPCWCQLIGCEQFGAKNDEDSFWIGFYILRRKTQKL